MFVLQQAKTNKQKINTILLKSSDNFGIYTMRLADQLKTMFGANNLLL